MAQATVVEVLAAEVVAVEAEDDNPESMTLPLGTFSVAMGETMPS